MVPGEVIETASLKLAAQAFVEADDGLVPGADLEVDLGAPCIPKQACRFSHQLGAQA